MKFVSVLLFASAAVAAPGGYGHGHDGCPKAPVMLHPGPTMRCAPPDCKAVLCAVPKKTTVPCHCPTERGCYGCEWRCCFPEIFVHPKKCQNPKPAPLGYCPKEIIPVRPEE